MSTNVANAKKRNSESCGSEDDVVDAPCSKRNCRSPTAVKRDEVSNSCCPFEHYVDKDCRVHMLSYLSVDDLTTCACVSRTFQDDCTHSTLPQSRTCEIICRSTNILHVFDRIRWNGWENVFQHPRSSLKVSHQNNLKTVRMRHLKKYNDMPLLTGVTSLDLSFSDQKAKSHRKLHNSISKAFSMMVPNLKELNLDNVEMTWTSLEAFSKNCPQLEILHLARSKSIHLTGCRGLEECKNLKEVYLDNATLECYFDSDDIRYHNVTDYCILSTVNEKLKKVSLLGTSCHNSWHDTSEPELIPQSGLIMFVQLAPKLKWFRSHLSKENIAMLQLERPDILFVSQG
jgi:hypothetical protein